MDNENNDLETAKVNDFESVEEIENNIKERKSKSNVKKVIRYIWSTLMILLLLFVLFEAIMGIFNMKRLSDNEEPIWYFARRYVEKDNRKETSFKMGLYDIVKIEEVNGSRITLKPFFIN